MSVTVPPLFDAATRKYFRDFANSITDYATTVTIAPVQRRADGSIIRDRDGNVLYGTPVTVNALVILQQENVVDTAGQTQLARGHATLSTPNPAVSTDDQLTLPDGTQPRITGITADLSTDPMGPTTVYFQ